MKKGSVPPLFLEVETDAGVEAVDAQITLIGKELADHRLICKVEDSKTSVILQVIYVY